MTDLLLNTDGGRENIIPRNGTYYSLKEMQGYVDGYVELITSPLGDKVMVVNENGKPQNLRFNSTATDIIQRWGYIDFIVGDAMLVSSSRIK